ncbi:hypothetical protein CANARDRAFT_22051 [[Candida] arabinofermentans NRRL YB-2248]|uniref:RRM domain-containing protein n=1 Tax=[Candida] arabinofermentans NRRL YB-2248 TaxID=983967 RepID=A0A1E4T318_9ASCO|nr:hypothetical protein CANARDRAFT_22051 [[Candida] arabinofermentans NRRL YB-2248]
MWLVSSCGCGCGCVWLCGCVLLCTSIDVSCFKEALVEGSLYNKAANKPVYHMSSNSSGSSTPLSYTSTSGTPPLSAAPKQKFKSQSVNSLFKRLSAEQTTNSTSVASSNKLSSSKFGQSTSTTSFEKGSKILTLRKSPGVPLNTVSSGGGDAKTVDNLWLSSSQSTLKSNNEHLDSFNHNSVILDESIPSPDEFSNKLWNGLNETVSSSSPFITRSSSHSSTFQARIPSNSNSNSNSTSRIGRNSIPTSNTWGLSDSLNQQSQQTDLFNLPSPFADLQILQPPYKSKSVPSFPLTPSYDALTSPTSTSTIHIQSKSQVGTSTSSLTASPVLWTTAPTIDDPSTSLNNSSLALNVGGMSTPTMTSRTSRFFPSPIAGDNSGVSAGSTSADLSGYSGRSFSQGFLPSSPLNMGSYNNTYSSREDSTNNGMGCGGLNVDLTSPSIDGSILQNQSLIPHNVYNNHQVLFTRLNIDSMPYIQDKQIDDDINNLSLFEGFSLGKDDHTQSKVKESVYERRLRNEPMSRKLLSRYINEDKLYDNYDDNIAEIEISIPSIPTKIKRVKTPINSSTKISKYIKTIITKPQLSTIQHHVYIASLPFDVPQPQVLTLINSAFSKFGDITHIAKYDDKPKNKVNDKENAGNDSFIRCIIVARLFNDSRTPFKSHKFVNSATGRDNKMLLFFEGYSTSSKGESTTTTPISSPSNSNNGKKWQEVQSFPEGFSSTFHRRGVNNFMFVRELQSKMIINKPSRSGGGGGGSRTTISSIETAEFRVSIPIEELGLGTSVDFNENDLMDNGNGNGNSNQSENRLKRSFVVNVDVRELENRPIPQPIPPPPPTTTTTKETKRFNGSKFVNGTHSRR